MNLYLISQDTNNGYDTCDSAIVCAASEDDARMIHPSGEWGYSWNTWCNKPEEVKVQLIGTATNDLKAGIVLTSFMAG